MTTRRKLHRPHPVHYEKNDIVIHEDITFHVNQIVTISLLFGNFIIRGRVLHPRHPRRLHHRRRRHRRHHPKVLGERLETGIAQRCSNANTIVSFVVNYHIPNLHLRRHRNH